MDDPLALLAPILVQLAAAESGVGRMRRAMPALVCVALASLGAAAAAGCLVAALWLWAMPQIGPVAAPAVCAAVLMLVCVILMQVASRLTDRRKAGTNPVLVEFCRHIDGARLIRDHKSDLLIAALVAGLIAGSPVVKHAAVD
jgi:hypothetical protein